MTKNIVLYALAGVMYMFIGYDLMYGSPGGGRYIPSFNHHYNLCLKAKPVIQSNRFTAKARSISQRVLSSSFSRLRCHSDVSRFGRGGGTDEIMGVYLLRYRDDGLYLSCRRVLEMDIAS